MTSFLYVVRCVLMLGVTTLTPCIAMQAVLQVPFWISIVAVGFFGILFTTFVNKINLFYTCEEKN